MARKAKRSETYKKNKGGECGQVERLAHCLRARWECVYCQEDLERDTTGKPTKAVHIDHVFPQLLGGGKGPKNQLASCGSCNCSKKAQLLREFAEGRGDLEMIRRVQRTLKRQLPLKRAKAIMSGK
jgi:5-methylcytosine-specific restriction endonuclease McrA